MKYSAVLTLILITLAVLPSGRVYAAVGEPATSGGDCAFSYFVDPLGAESDITLSGANAKKFSPLTSANNSLGMTTATLWVRGQCKSSRAMLQDSLLELANPLLDEVNLYDDKGSITFSFRKNLPLGERFVPHYNFLIPLREVSNPAQFYLRIRTQGTMYLPIRVLSTSKFVEDNSRQTLGLGLYYGVILAMLIYNLFLFFSLRDESYGYYVGFVASYLVFQFSLNGFGFAYLWTSLPWWADKSIPIMIWITYAFIFQFARSFLEIGSFSQRLSKALYFVSGLSLFLAAASAVMSYRDALKVAVFCSTFLSSALYLIGFYALAKGSRGARYYVIAWTVFLLGILLMSLRNFGILPGTFVTNYAMQIGSGLETLLLSLGLADRIRKLKHDRMVSEIEALRYVQLLDSNFASQKQAKALFEQASQIAHDIRSPLTALNMVVSTLANIESAKQNLLRLSINRINDIANDLLAKNKGDNIQDDDLEPQLISRLIEQLISEKRAEYGDRPGLKIRFENHVKGAAFGLLKPNDFNRVLSNLVNNAIEASRSTGTITLSLSVVDEKVIVQVKDQGAGIPPELLEVLGHQPVTYGKPDGNGLGVYSARKAVQTWDRGDLRISSEVGVGTVVAIEFLSSSGPDWFVEDIEFDRDGCFVTVDDDVTIHQAWSQRLAAAGLPLENHIQLLNREQLKAYLKLSSRRDRFLVDYEFAGASYSGVSLVKEFNLQNQAILVTSRFEDAKVLREVRQVGLKLIPKSLVSATQLRQSKSKSLKHYDAVIIDDDELVHLVWKAVSREKGKSIECFYGFSEFEEKMNSISLESPIYIDSHLGRTRGESFVPRLKQHGFRTVAVCTGDVDLLQKRTVHGVPVYGKDPIF